MLSRTPRYYYIAFTVSKSGASKPTSIHSITPDVNPDVNPMSHVATSSNSLAQLPKYNTT